VYLTLKKVFKGPNAGVRRMSVIRKLINENQQHEDIAALINKHNEDILCNVTRKLLTEQIFESTLKAKMRFPEIFSESPAQSAHREASDAEAARNDTKAMQDAVQGPQGGPTNTTQSLHHTPSLFPVYLPFRTQHYLLLKVQAILERACFEFGRRIMPDFLKEHGWDCPECAELNLWAYDFLRHQDLFSEEERSVGKPYADLFRSVAHIRHTAVHRISLSAMGIEQFLLDAESLAMLLNNEECLNLLTKLRQSTQSAIEELERNKHVLRSKLEDTLKRVAAQRAEFDRLQNAAVTEMVKEDGEYQAFAGTNLEQAIE
ncbi:hypothetical protein CONLIGDRAFT_562822, partial [Coniochaeta ligniaria NRRL 30616]